MKHDADSRGLAPLEQGFHPTGADSASAPSVLTAASQVEPLLQLSEPDFDGADTVIQCGDMFPEELHEALKAEARACGLDAAGFARVYEEFGPTDKELFRGLLKAICNLGHRVETYEGPVGPTCRNGYDLIRVWRKPAPTDEIEYSRMSNEAVSTRLLELAPGYGVKGKLHAWAHELLEIAQNGALGHETELDYAGVQNDIIEAISNCGHKVEATCSRIRIWRAQDQAPSYSPNPEQAHDPVRIAAIKTTSLALASLRGVSEEHIGALSSSARRIAASAMRREADRFDPPKREVLHLHVDAVLVDKPVTPRHSVLDLKIEAILAGKRMILSDKECDQIAALPDDWTGRFATLPNPYQVGIMDRWIGFLA